MTTVTIGCGLNEVIDAGYMLPDGKVVVRVVSRENKIMRKPLVPCLSFRPYAYAIVVAEVA